MVKITNTIPQYKIMSSALVCILSLQSISAFSLFRKSYRPPIEIASTSHRLSMTSTTTDTGNIDNGSHISNKGQLLKKYYGGDYAGHIATFSQTTGKLIPVPDYYVPETLIEWGMIPSSFELLTSEDIAFPGDNDENLPQLNRVGIRVIPETGCGVDNLDTLVKKDSISISSLETFDSHGTASSILRSDDTNTKFVLETIFAPTTSLPPSEIRNTEQDQGGDSILKRIRVSLTIESLPQLSLAAPIEVIVERQTSIVSSEGKVVDGGGLTGSAVYQLIGDSANKPFSDKQGFKLDRLTGRWISSSNMTDGEVNEYDVDSYLNKGSLCTLSLPGNVIIQYEKIKEKRTFPWIIEVSLIEDEGEGHAVRRRVMQRIFDKAGASTVKCWDEVKAVEI